MAGRTCIANDLLRPCKQIFCRHIRIGGYRNERRVCAIFKQASHEIGEQIRVTAHRRISAARESFALIQQMLIKRVAHAM